MLIFDDVFSWEGFGGRLKLAHGCCWLRIYDLDLGSAAKLAHLKSKVVVAWDHPESRLSVRSISGHIATHVARIFEIDPQRMQFVEYHPEVVYGRRPPRVIPHSFEAVDFVWKNQMALHPTLRPVEPSLLKRLHAWFDQHPPAGT